MENKKYLLSEIQKEAYGKGLEAKVKFDKIIEEHRREYPGSFMTKEETMKKLNLSEEEYSEEIEKHRQGMITWTIYQDKIFEKDVWGNLVDDGGYEPFKELAQAYVLRKKEQAMFSAEFKYKEDVSLVKKGKFPEETKKEVIKIDTPASSAAFIIGTTISGGDPKVGKAFAKLIKKIERRYKKCTRDQFAFR